MHLVQPSDRAYLPSAVQSWGSIGPGAAEQVAGNQWWSGASMVEPFHASHAMKGQNESGWHQGAGPMTNRSDEMGGDRRAHEYAKCTYTLTHQPNLDGREAVFDSALSNGLTVLVANTWPSEETMTRGGS
jgi:hypothetical protein